MGLGRWGAALALVVSVDLAYAAPVVPEFDPDTHVYVQPDTYRFSAQRTEMAAEVALRDVYVVVYEQVMKGPLDPAYESYTEQAIETVWGTWAVHPAFDASESSVIVLAMDDREVRVVTGSTWDTEYGLHTRALLPVIDDHFLPRARAQDFDGALASLVGGLDDEISSRVHTRTRRDTFFRALRIGLPIGGVLLAVIMGLVTAGALQASARERRERFEAGVAQLRKLIDRGESSLADLQIDVEMRDQVVALRAKGERTEQLVSDVMTRFDDIQVGLAALRKHVGDVEAQVGKPGPFDRAAWDEALQALQGRFSFDTGEVQHRLFAGPTRVIEIDPAEIMERLEERYEEAVVRWERVLDAVETSLHDARSDLPDIELEAMRHSLTEEGLPPEWTRQHPLFDDPEEVWERLDGLRLADPVAYLEELEELDGVEETVMVQVADLLAGWSEAHRARSEALALDVSELDTRVDEPRRDPAVALRDAEELLGRLAEFIQRPDGDLAAVVACADDTASAFIEVRQRSEALRDAVHHGETRLQEAEGQVEVLRSKFRTSREVLEALLAHHVPSSMREAWTEVGEAVNDLRAAEAALERGRFALAERRHLRAVDAVDEALREHGEAIANLLELTAVLERLEKVRADATAALATLDQVRADAVQKMRSCEAPRIAERLGDGDRLHRALTQQPWAAEDYGSRLAQVHDVIAAWNREVSKARTEYRKEQARKRAAAEAARRAAAARRRSNSYSYSSSRRSYSSLSSSSSRSSFGRSSSSSFGSSRRSGGRSFSSSRRSGGRSFSSSRRSAGRKF